MSSYAIETQNLTKTYKRRKVVDQLNLSVPAGSVFAFLGTNGAGKTTTIQMLMNLIRPQAGHAKIMGLDSVKDSLQIRQRVGYVGQNQKLYDWMKVDEITWFCRGFYKNWDDEFTKMLKRRLELDGKQKIGSMSVGMQAKVALLLALSHHPELLILDEPTAGLDVLVRRQFFEGIIQLIQEEERTIFFSTHLVHEVERMADWVGFLDDGKLIWCSPLEDLKNNVKRITLTFADNPPSKINIHGAIIREVDGRQTSVIVRSFSDQSLLDARSYKPINIQVDDLSLEDIFVAMATKTGVIQHG